MMHKTGVLKVYRLLKEVGRRRRALGRRLLGRTLSRKQPTKREREQ